MPQVKLTRSHALSMDEARKRVLGLVEKFHGRFEKYIKKVEWAPDQTSGTCIGRGFDAHFLLTPGVVEVVVDLGFVLRLIQGKVAEGITRQLDEAFPR